jgi:hypothetical protein
MIRQGSDGLSRGDMLSGVMGGKDMLCFVPLHLSALKRSPLLKPWAESWWGDDYLEWLSPDDWFATPHQGGNLYGALRPLLPTQLWNRCAGPSSSAL